MIGRSLVLLVVLAGPATAQDRPLTSLFAPRALATPSPLSTPDPLLMPSPLTGGDTPLFPTTPLSGPSAAARPRRADAVPCGRPQASAGSLSYGGAGPGEFQRYVPQPPAPAGQSGATSRPAAARAAMPGATRRAAPGTARAGTSPYSDAIPDPGESPNTGADPAELPSVTAPVMDRPLWASGTGVDTAGCGPASSIAQPTPDTGFYGSGAPSSSP